jgi:hypothetical protein
MWADPDSVRQHLSRLACPWQAADRIAPQARNMPEVAHPPPLGSGLPGVHPASRRQRPDAFSPDSTHDRIVREGRGLSPGQYQGVVPRVNATRHRRPHGGLQPSGSALRRFERTAKATEEVAEQDHQEGDKHGDDQPFSPAHRTATLSGVCGLGRPGIIRLPKLEPN